jgi:hypothetical protein
MSPQVQKAVMPATEEPVANFLNCGETVRDFGHFVDVYERNAVGHVQPNSTARVP